MSLHLTLFFITCMKNYIIGDREILKSLYPVIFSREIAIVAEFIDETCFHSV